MDLTSHKLQRVANNSIHNQRHFISRVEKMAASGRERFENVMVFGYSIDFFRELGRGAFGTVY